MRYLVLTLALLGSVTGFAQEKTVKHQFTCDVSGYFDPQRGADFHLYNSGKLTVKTAPEGDSAYVEFQKDGVTSKLVSLTGPHVTLNQDDAEGYSLLSGYSAYSNELTLDLVKKTAKYSYYFTPGGWGTGKDSLVYSVDFANCR